MTDCPTCHHQEKFGLKLNANSVVDRVSRPVLRKRERVVTEQEYIDVSRVNDRIEMRNRENMRAVSGGFSGCTKP